MKAEDLLKYGPDELEKLTDSELSALFAKYFTVTRPALDLTTKNKLEALTGVRVGKGGPKASKNVAAQPDLLSALGALLSPEQMKSLQEAKNAKKK